MLGLKLIHIRKKGAPGKWDHMMMAHFNHLVSQSSPLYTSCFVALNTFFNYYSYLQGNYLHGFVSFQHDFSKFSCFSRFLTNLYWTNFTEITTFMNLIIMQPPFHLMEEVLNLRNVFIYQTGLGYSCIGNAWQEGTNERRLQESHSKKVIVCNKIA